MLKRVYCFEGIILKLNSSCSQTVALEGVHTRSEIAKGTE